MARLSVVITVEECKDLREIAAIARLSALILQQEGVEKVEIRPKPEAPKPAKQRRPARRVAKRAGRPPSGTMADELEPIFREETAPMTAEDLADALIERKSKLAEGVGRQQLAKRVAISLGQSKARFARLGLGWRLADQED